ncbi:hypothetical protein [Paenibacillus sp. B01]|uniref:hypothetical protein n=1 Tax=Paenibacillus sp. B01 TaxID=2660554 RepID=UPI00129AD2E3|nr:hypothetical protein [Paenibacillus sp. B01]QGG57892.1 hypothetical protein GE073_21525 [Paenibacillus sp. B01]
MYDLDGQRCYVSSNGDDYPPDSGNAGCSSSGTPPLYPSSNANVAESSRQITIQDPLGTPLKGTSTGSMEFALTQVATVKVKELKYNGATECPDTCMPDDKVITGTIAGTSDKVTIDDSNKSNIVVDFRWTGRFDGGSYTEDTNSSNGLTRKWFNSWRVTFSAETYKYDEYYVLAFYGNTPAEDPCVTNPSSCGGSTGGGSGKVIFTPNDTAAKDGSIVRGWARYNFTVTASVVDYVKAEQTTNVPWRKPQPCIPWSSPTGGGCTPQPDLTGTAVYYCWRDKEDNITITGSYSGTNSVQITNEGYQQKLSGQVNWKPYQWR